jgi:virginiamycin B lyase
MIRVLMLAAAGLAAAPAIVSAPLQIEEWTVPWEKSRPRDPYADAQGRVWFVGQAGNYIAYLDPASGQFKRYEIEEGTHPHNLIVDRAGQVWYAGNRNGMIGRLDPTSGAIKRYPMPDAAAGDPHTLVFDRSGDIWFTVQQGNFVGKLETGSGKVRLVRVPTPNARPYGIAVDSKNRPWFNEFGTSKLGTVDPKTFTLREYDLPDPDARGRRIAITSDDRIWYGDYVRGVIGRLDPATGKIQEWDAPSKRSALIYALTVDDRDRLWFVETGPQPNRFVGFDTKTLKVVSETPIAKSGALVVRHMSFDPPSRSIWFGTDANTIGRARLP